jgi:hypothetical protein
VIQQLGPFLGEWCDVDWSPADGAFVFAREERPGVIALSRLDTLGNLVAATRRYALPAWGLYLRCAADGAGNVCCVLQDGRDRNPATGQFYPAICVLFPKEGPPREIGCPAGPAFGQNAVEVDGHAEGFFVYVVTSAVRYWHGNLSSVGAWEWAGDGSWPQTSQGFADGEARMDDVRLSVPGMVCPSTANGLSLGQNTSGPDRLVARQGDVLFTALPGVAFEPHLVSDGQGHWMGCARTPQGAALFTLAAPFEADTPPPEPPTPLPDIPWTTDPHGVVEDIWPWLAPHFTALSPDGRVGFILKSDEVSADGVTIGEWWDHDDHYIGHLEDASTGHRLYQGKRYYAHEWVALGQPVPWASLPLARNRFDDGARLWLPRRCVTGQRFRYVTNIRWNNGYVQPNIPIEIRIEVGYGRYQGREARVRGFYIPGGNAEENWYGPADGWVRHIPAGVA